MNVEEKIYKGHEIEIEYDENPQNPRTEWDNICVFHIALRNYSFGDKNYSDMESICKAERKAKRNGDITLPIYLFDHSGITISLSPFSCRWDSGQCGFIQIPRKKMIEEFGGKIFTPKLKKRALEIAKGEVETLDSYLRGEIYGYVIDEGTGDGESCWGYYSVKDAMDEAKSIVDYVIEEAKKKHYEQLKRWIKNKVPLYIRTTFSTALAVE